MAIIKCKMCGGDLSFAEDASTAQCEYCGSLQTIPKADNEKKLTLFARANRLRAACEFDKAAGIYESIVADFPEEAEAYWGLVLCKFGIEYVDDPATGKKIPTCHRSSFDSVMEDSDFEQAQENADAVARKVYREEAKAIEELRKGIIAVSANEEPYDIFICYKETDDAGDRTLDSVLAQDVYDALTNKGYRVFFSRISLEDKLGVEYEPYIFAALNSAKIMLVFGTDYEYFNAVWVKNEWSRFLKLMAKDKEKYLIPCYKGIDAYDMPKEFAKLQAQDLGKVGAIQDLLRGVEKLVSSQSTAQNSVQTATPGTFASPTVESYLKRAFMFLEDSDWKCADEYCEKVLDLDPENPQAYIGKLLSQKHLRDTEELRKSRLSILENKYYIKAMRYGNSEQRALMQACAEEIERNIEHHRLECIYNEAMELVKKDDGTGDTLSDGVSMRKIIPAADYRRAAELMQSISGYKDADDLAAEFLVQAENMCAISQNQELEQIYQKALSKYLGVTLAGWEQAINLFDSISGYKDSAAKKEACIKKIKEKKPELEAMAARNIKELEYRRNNLCQYCGAPFKGFFVLKCTRCGQLKDY